MSLRIGSLCSGYGGLDLAVEAVTGARTAWFVEYDDAPSRILAHHWPDVPNHGDVKGTDWSRVEPVDILTAGYPCQPFSHAGKRKGSDDPRHLWPDVARAIGALRPGLVVLENVRGHVSLGLADVLGDLSGLGYDARWGVVRASDTGAPHGRARVFIVATPDTDCRRSPQFLRHGRDARLSVAREFGCEVATADTDGTGLEGRRVHPERADEQSPRAGGVAAPDRRWRQYGAAIRRWEHVIGRTAPDPTEPGRNGRPRLAAPFVEWMMGLPVGHVTAAPLSRTQQLKALGNGVVPQQAVLALSLLLGAEAAA